MQETELKKVLEKENETFENIIDDLLSKIETFDDSMRDEFIEKIEMAFPELKLIGRV